MWKLGLDTARMSSGVGTGAQSQHRLQWRPAWLAAIQRDATPGSKMYPRQGSNLQLLLVLIMFRKEMYQETLMEAPYPLDHAGHCTCHARVHGRAFARRCACGWRCASYK